jgi:predicted DNA-binding protein (MmcQ/YjbR family)
MRDAPTIRAARQRIRDVCLELPVVVAKDVRQHTKFTVKTKAFCYFLVDHHGDGMLGVVVKTRDGENEQMVRNDPQRFYSPAYVGPKGWVGIRVDVNPVPWENVATLVEDSYRLVAPRSLVRRIGS